MTSYVSADIRRIVVGRADSRCEYCLIHERDTYLGLQVDHVIAEKHGGSTSPDNLALACAFCNRFKGTDLGSRSASGDLLRFFNPRTDKWNDHFKFETHVIVPKTEIGAVTIKILQMNASERIAERELLNRKMEM